MKKINTQKGQLLLEAVVAIGLVGIIVTGIVTALIYSVGNSNTSRDQNQATSYAQEGLDIARDLKDSDFASFTALDSTRDGDYNLPDGYTIISVDNPPAAIGNRFLRQIYINQTGKDKSGTVKCTNTPSAFVASIVTWSDSKCRSGNNCHKTELNSCFTDPAKVFY